MKPPNDIVKQSGTYNIKITKSGTIKFSEAIGVNTLEALDGFLLDDIVISNKEGDEVGSWMSMEEFRNDAPNADKFTLFFTYGNGMFWVNVENEKFNKVLADTDMEDMAEVRYELNSLSKELELAVVKLQNTKEAIVDTNEPSADIDLF